MLRTPSRENGTRAHFFSRRWAHNRLSTKACTSEGDGGRSTGSGMDIVKLVGGITRRCAPRPCGAAGSKAAGSTRMAISMPNCHGTIFLKLVGATGFEPATLWSQTRCATRLRHAPSLPTATGRVGAVIVPRFALRAGTLQPVDCRRPTADRLQHTRLSQSEGRHVDVDVFVRSR
jgi:hypothetical protein